MSNLVLRYLTYRKKNFLSHLCTFSGKIYLHSDFSFSAQGSAGSSGDRKDINPVLNKRSYGPQKYNRQEDRYQGERFHNNYKSHHGRGNSSDQYMPQGNSGNQFYNSRGNSRDRFNNPRGYSSDRFNSNKHNQRNSGDKYPRDHSLQPRPSTSEFSGVDSVYDIINDKNNQSNNNKQVMRERNEIHGDGKPNNKFQRDANKRDLESLKEKTTDGVAFIKQFNKPKKMRGQQHEKQMRGKFKLRKGRFKIYLWLSLIFLSVQVLSNIN